jgi:hypothetical protein
MLVMAYAPITIASFALICPAVYKSFATGTNQLVTIVVTCATFSIIAGCHMLLRTAQGRLGEYAQALAIGSAAAALLLSWQAVNTGGSGMLWQCLIISIVGMHAILLVYELYCRPKTIFEIRAASRRQWHWVTIAGSFVIRAYRTRRYRGANIFLFILLVGLSAGVALHRQIMPYDAVAVICLLLGGTLAQEARTLSSAYPVELFLYSSFNQWLRSTWMLGLSNGVVFIEMLLVIAFVVFPESVSATYWQMICIGTCLTAVATAAGALVVPDKNDILAQLASTFLYGGFAYGVMRLIGGQTGIKMTILSAVIIVASAGLAYAAERVRWLTTIKGWHAVIHQ